MHFSMPDDKIRYDMAQICERGHLITDSGKTTPELLRDFCKECGSRTLTACLMCERSIDGRMINSGAYGFEFPVPQYCVGCGSPFPWTTSRIDTLLEAIEELEIDDGDKEKLKTSVIDIISETDKTPIAVSRYKRVVGALNERFQKMMWNVFSNVATATVKQQMGLD